MKKIKEIYIITLILIVIGVTTTFATAGTVNTNGVRMRAGASIEAEIITNLHNGDKVEIIEKTGDWYKIKYNGQEGYIHSDYVSADEIVVDVDTGEQVTEGSVSEEPKQEEQNELEPETYPKTVVTVSNTKVYIIPSVTSSVVIEIEEGKTITINNKISNWSYITYENQKGWARNYNLEQATQSAKPQEGVPAEQTSAENNNTETTKKGYVNVESANVRQEANTSSNVITVLSRNAEIIITAEEGDWYKIKYNETEGYISKSLISDTQITTSRSNGETRQEDVTPITPEIREAYINASVANIRADASTSSAIVTTLKQKAKVEIIGEEGDFYQININEGTAYVSKGLIVNSLDEITIKSTTNTTVSNTTTGSQKTESVSKSSAKAVEVASSGSSSGTNVVDFAKKYIGYKYKYGGTTPSGFDCSGFVYYVFNSCGYSLSRSCSVQAKSGTAVSKANLKSGDLVFFNNGSGGSIGHVGIYIGGGKFVHAANPSKGVRIDTLNSGYYNTYYYSARRVI